MKSYSIQEINAILNGELIGNTTQKIDGLEQLKNAKPHQMTFIGSIKYERLWDYSKATAAIVNENIRIAPGEGRAFIKVKNADLAMAKLLEEFDPGPPQFDIEIHPTAVIHESATLGKGVKIGANSYVGKNVVLADGVILYPNVSIFDDTTVTIIGAQCIFHTNVSIGADGFGYRPSDDGRGLVKIPQIGNVVIGNLVEIGSNSCVDRGKFSSTIIGDGCKIDNLVQIGHNSVMGRVCMIGGDSGLAG
jgi:UDP-3-O-[3-hydroxymyristoyl] glucosamine N-acyltransferase